MNKSKFTLWGLLFMLLISSCKINSEKSEKHFNQLKVPESFISKLQWTGAKLADKDYSIWGSSPIIGDDGKVHVFAARWPEKNVDPAWRKSSEIAHYVADTPEGNYKFSDVAIKGSGIKGAWDCYAPHNPEVKKIGDYYVITYIANSDYHQPPHPNNQRIGLVYSKSLYGPWKKAGKNGMIIEVSSDPNHWTYGDASVIANPCINQIDGKIVIYFKNRVLKNKKVKSKYGYATAETIEGPYTMSDQAITDNDSYIEDATTFTLNGKYYLLTTDNHGSLTGIEGGGVLWQSDDWRKFDVADIKVAYKLISSYYSDYKSRKPTKIYGNKPKFERPKILMIDGKPGYLFAPSGWNIEGGERSVCYITKIKDSGLK